MPLECFDGAKISYFFYISKLFRDFLAKRMKSGSKFFTLHSSLFTSRQRLSLQLPASRTAARVTTARWCLGFGIGCFLRCAVVHLHGLFVQSELVAELAANAGTECPLDSVGSQHVLGGNGRAVVLVGVGLNFLVAD